MKKWKIWTLVTSIVWLAFAPQTVTAQTTSDSKTVHLAGTYLINDKLVASYWKNGERYDLNIPPKGIGAYANAITVSGTTVYIAGEYSSNDAEFACYWKDGVGHDLISPQGFTADVTIIGVTNNESSIKTTPYIKAIAVSGSDVYVAGDHYIEYHKDGAIRTAYAACYWKDGEKQTRHDMKLPKGAVYTHATGIAVSGSDVYVSGYYITDSGNEYPCYWKNGVFQNISTRTMLGRANAVAVSGSDVYVVGHYMILGNNMTNACYWKNGVKHDMNFPEEAFDSHADAITIDGSDIYITGNYFRMLNRQAINAACYWKNGVWHNLDGPQGTINLYANHIAVSDSNVYIAGSHTLKANDNIACYWINGMPHSIAGTRYGIVDIAVSSNDAVSSPFISSWKTPVAAPPIPAAAVSDLVGTWEIEVRESNYHIIHRRVFEANGTWKWYHIDVPTKETTEVDCGTYTINGSDITLVDDFNHTKTITLLNGILRIIEDANLMQYKRR